MLGSLQRTLIAQRALSLFLWVHLRPQHTKKERFMDHESPFSDLPPVYWFLAQSSYPGVRKQRHLFPLLLEPRQGRGVSLQLILMLHPDDD